MCVVDVVDHHCIIGIPELSNDIVFCVFLFLFVMNEQKALQNKLRT
jgi:hypothetical protein